MKHSFLIGFLLWAFATQAEIYFRYNHAGYTPSAAKEIIILSDEDISSHNWSVSKNNNVVKEGFLTLSLAGRGKHTPKPYSYSVKLSALSEVGEYKFQLDSAQFGFKISEKPYDFIPKEILRYFRVQRSGTTQTLDSRVSHVGDKSCKVYTKSTGANSSWQENENIENVDLMGGWYDAGDYIKFTLTTAYASYFMLRAYEANPSFFDYQEYSKSKLNDILDEAQWGLDYLMKCYPEESLFLIQVGSADDHKQGKRMPHRDELDGERQAYAALSPTQIGYTAASLSLGAQLFKDIDPELAAAYLEKAKAVFEKGLQSQDIAWISEGWETFYADKTKDDNLALAAIELYRATNNSRYLNLAKNLSQNADQAWWYSWGSVNMIAHQRIAEVDSDFYELAKKDLQHFTGIANEENNIWGVPNKYTWGSLYSFIGISNAAFQANVQNGDSSFIDIYQDMLDYTLGRNNWGISFVASEKIPDCIENVYAQVYQLQPKKFPTGAVAEGPGDKETHDRMMQYFKIPKENPFEEFNTGDVVFYDDNTDFQCMETTICGLAASLYFFTLVNTHYK